MLVAEMQRQMAAFGAQELANITWALAVLGLRPNAAWLRDFEMQVGWLLVCGLQHMQRFKWLQHVTTNRHWDLQDTQDLSWTTRMDLPECGMHVLWP